MGVYGEGYLVAGGDVGQQYSPKKLGIQKNSKKAVFNFPFVLYCY